MDPTVQLTQETHKQVILHTCEDLTGWREQQRAPNWRGLEDFWNVPQTNSANTVQPPRCSVNPAAVHSFASVNFSSLKFWIYVCSCHRKEAKTSNFWCQSQSNFQNEQQTVQFSVKKQTYHYLSSLELQDDTGSPHFLSCSSGPKHTRTPLHYWFWPSEQKITEGQNRNINCANMMKETSYYSRVRLITWF